MKLQQRLLFEFESWKSSVVLSNPILNVRYIKIGWMYYETATTDNIYMTLAFRNSDINQHGLKINSNGSTDDYFYSVPLDTRQDVGLFYSERDEPDIILNYPIPKLSRFDLEARINGLPTADITSSNKLLLEIKFYSDYN